MFNWIRKIGKNEVGPDASPYYSNELRRQEIVAAVEVLNEKLKHSKAASLGGYRGLEIDNSGATPTIKVWSGS